MSEKKSTEDLDALTPKNAQGLGADDAHDKGVEETQEMKSTAKSDGKATTKLAEKRKEKPTTKSGASELAKPSRVRKTSAAKGTVRTRVARVAKVPETSPEVTLITKVLEKPKVPKSTVKSGSVSKTQPLAEVAETPKKITKKSLVQSPDTFSGQVLQEATHKKHPRYFSDKHEEYIVPHVAPPSHDSFEIVVKDLHKHFGKKKAVNGISFNIHSSEMVGILGPNGAGKTTAFYMIVGFLKPNAGTIMLNDVNITHYPMYKRAQLGISYLPQEASVFRQLSVEKNIMAVLQTMKNLSRKERKYRLDTLLDEFGIVGLRKQKAYTLSGGERRRTEIARCMALSPKFILLDEPFTGIDPKARHELKQIIASLSQKNVGVLITDHNERDTLSIIDRAFIVYNGKIIIGGSHDEIVQNVQAREVYLGENYN